MTDEAVEEIELEASKEEAPAATEEEHRPVDGDAQDMIVSPTSESSSTRKKRKAQQAPLTEIPEQPLPPKFHYGSRIGRLLSSLEDLSCRIGADCGPCLIFGRANSRNMLRVSTEETFVLLPRMPPIQRMLKRDSRVAFFPIGWESRVPSWE